MPRNYRRSKNPNPAVSPIIRDESVVAISKQLDRNIESLYANPFASHDRYYGAKETQTTRVQIAPAKTAPRGSEGLKRRTEIDMYKWLPADRIADRFYFAYGSNLNRLQMKERCPDSVEIAAFTLRGYELIFRRVADITPKIGSYVVGAIYRISARDQWILDGFEGCIGDDKSRGGTYRREYFYLHPTSGKRRLQPQHGDIPVLYYAMNRSHIQSPDRSYLNRIEAGYDDWELPTDSLVDAVTFARGHDTPIYTSRSTFETNHTVTGADRVRQMLSNLNDRDVTSVVRRSSYSDGFPPSDLSDDDSADYHEGSLDLVIPGELCPHCYGPIDDGLCVEECFESREEAAYMADYKFSDEPSPESQVQTCESPDDPTIPIL